uniref:Uncharacterized protein n=1 Tax=Romanomermis culicivorax TaxID=13658 RepID=A0A915JYI8_ROMCU
MLTTYIMSQLVTEQLIIMISGAAPAPWAIAPEVTKYFTKQIIDHVRCQGEDEVECLKFRPYFRMSFGGTMALSKDASHNTADPFSEKV